jgi:hypothetical protein
MPSRIACSCPDWRLRGSDLSRERLLNKVTLAEAVTVDDPEVPGELLTWTTRSDFHHVTLLEDGEFDRLCKHCIAVLWHAGFDLYLVEYTGPLEEDDRNEVRAETFWGEEMAVKIIMEDREVVRVTKLERKGDESHE